LAFAVQRIKLVAAADMGFADEYLREGRTGASTVVHLLARRRIYTCIIFGERGFLAVQKRFGRAAIAAPRPCIDFDRSGHVAFAKSRKIDTYIGGFGLS